MVLTHRSAKMATSLLGLSVLRLHANSRGYKFWIALSRWVFPACSLAACTVPSTPSISSTIMPSFHWFLIFLFTPCYHHVSFQQTAQFQCFFHIVSHVTLAHTLLSNVTKEPFYISSGLYPQDEMLSVQAAGWIL